MNSYLCHPASTISTFDSFEWHSGIVSPLSRRQEYTISCLVGTCWVSLMNRLHVSLTDSLFHVFWLATLIYRWALEFHSVLLFVVGASFCTPESHVASSHHCIFN